MLDWLSRYWGALIFVVPFVIVVPILVGWKLKHSIIPWKPLPGWPRARYVSPASVPGEMVGAALTAAAKALVSAGVWDAAQVARCSQQVSIFVVDAESWKDDWGRQVAGLDAGYALYVDRKLSALCHELAHHCETVLEGKTDATHATWAGRGIFKAIDDYQRVLPNVYV